jgi:hypothetical protein
MEAARRCQGEKWEKKLRNKTTNADSLLAINREARRSIDDIK